ncbi:hypothetical protein EV126DRAFT_424161 [Verticillium dahliae]|nr:hypothetical protein EV126DRAFT_424161 [Verticillium dahliae]
MISVTCQVLDNDGLPLEGLQVHLECVAGVRPDTRFEATTDEDGRVTYWNQRHAEALLTTEGELLPVYVEPGSSSSLRLIFLTQGLHGCAYNPLPTLQSTLDVSAWSSHHILLWINRAHPSYRVQHLIARPSSWLIESTGALSAMVSSPSSSTATSPCQSPPGQVTHASEGKLDSPPLLTFSSPILPMANNMWTCSASRPRKRKSPWDEKDGPAMKKQCSGYIDCTSSARQHI